MDMRAFVVALIAPLAALVLASCATVQKLDAAGDVHALLIAIRDDDQATFDALVDRRALRLEIEQRLVTEARRSGPVPSGLAALLAPGLARLAGDTLIQPGVFRSVAAYYGYRRDMKIPGPVGISTMLRQMPDGRVCAVTKKSGPCLLIFAHAPDGRWKLAGFEGDVGMLQIKR
jgi:hypothetical protein